MKYNLKNRPRPYSTRKNPTKDECAWLRWAQGFEKELRDISANLEANCKNVGKAELIEEILGKEKP